MSETNVMWCVCCCYCRRQQSRSLLSTKPNGTFLVRPKDPPDWVDKDKGILHTHTIDVMWVAQMLVHICHSGSFCLSTTVALSRNVAGSIATRFVTCFSHADCRQLHVNSGQVDLCGWITHTIIKVLDHVLHVHSHQFNWLCLACIPCVVQCSVCCCGGQCAVNCSQVTHE